MDGGSCGAYVGSVLMGGCSLEIVCREGIVAYGWSIYGNFVEYYGSIGGSIDGVLLRTCYSMVFGFVSALQECNY